MNAILIASFNEAAKAQPLKRCLEEAGIPAEIHDEPWMELLWFVARPLARIKVTVHERDYKRALSLLPAWNTPDGPLAAAVRCPECSSCRVQYPQFAAKSLLPNIMIGLLAFLHVIKREYYCQDCHFTWPRKGTKPSRVRPHMAPYYFLEGIAQPDAPAPQASESSAKPVPLQKPN
jgi:hypothetical protein